MIKIYKDKFPPDIRYKTGTKRGLLKWKVAEIQMLRDFNSAPQQFNSGTYNFPSLPCYKEFRDELVRVQGPKCCYCEKPVHNGDIEHFRPKSAWQQGVGSPLNRPGYFWLAYRWENLLISCSDCNKKGQKGNLFPIVGNRANFANRDCRVEQAVIIHPAEERPEDFISYNQDVPVGIDGNGRGEANIQIFKLRTRADLKPIREDRYDKYKLLSDIANSIIQASAERKLEAKNFLKKAFKKKEPFSGMLVANLIKGNI